MEFDMQNRFENSVTGLEFDFNGFKTTVHRKDNGLFIVSRHNPENQKPYPEYYCGHKSQGYFWSWQYKDDDPAELTLLQVMDLFFKDCL